MDICISVVITVFNEWEYLPRCLQSVIAQSMPPGEILVVDDGSSEDRGREIIDSIASHCPVRLLRKENGGPSSARNHGLRHCTGPLVAFVDVDDYWLKDNLAYKSSLLKSKTQEYFGSYGSFVVENCDDPHPFQTVDGLPDADSVGKKLGIPGGAPAYLFRRDSLLQIGGFDEQLVINEDFALILELIKKGSKCIGDSTPGFVRTLRPESLTRSTAAKQKYELVQRFLEKARERNYFSEKELLRRANANAIECVRRADWKKMELDAELYSQLSHDLRLGRGTLGSWLYRARLEFARLVGR